MSPDPVADLARLRAICMALPLAAEKLSHGMPVFYIEKGRTFAWFAHDHHGIGITAAIVKVSGIDEHRMLVEVDPELFYRPAYFVAESWVGIRLDLPETDWEQIAARITASWTLAASPRQREKFEPERPT